MSDRLLNFAIIGVGSLGKTHYQNVKELAEKVKFGNMFEAVHIEKSDAILRYLFRWDTTRYNLKFAVAYNSFTEAVKSHVMKGGEFYEVLGVLR